MPRPQNFDGQAGHWVEMGQCVRSLPLGSPLRRLLCPNLSAAVPVLLSAPGREVTCPGAVRGSSTAPHPAHAAKKQDLSAGLSAALGRLHPQLARRTDCPARASSAAASSWKPGTLESGHFLSVLAGDGAALREAPGSAPDPDHHVARGIGNIFVSPVEMF